MLDALVNISKGKYDWFFATVSKENKKAIKADINDGWKIVGETQYLYYLVYKI